jgi:hypothetical protein
LGGNGRDRYARRVLLLAGHLLGDDGGPGRDVKIVAEYRRRAAEVEKLAESAISEDHRKRVLEIAREWRDLADQRERQLGGRPVGNKPST